MKTEIEKTDLSIQADVIAELSYDPEVKVTDIGVLVKDGIVTLNGYATSYGEKWEAVKAAKRVARVVAIVDNIELMLPNSIHHTDEHIAAAAVNQIEATPAILPGTVQITVSEGWITLGGEVECWHQRDAAKNAVLHLSGVTGVSNMISLKPPQSSEKAETAIQLAFKRNSLLATHQIKVQKSENNVSLSGDVRNHAEREEAERVAWSAPGVTSVDNHLAVIW